MADNLNSYISKFKPASYFFADPAGISQSSAQAFGPVVGHESDQFRLTTKFTVSGTKAFAVCKGIALVQPQTGNANCVNLILRPYTQPIQGFNIKYFIYRGLKKSDFFSGDNVIAVTDATSDLINKINNSFISFYNTTSPGEPLPDFLAKFIGFDPVNQPDNLALSDFFFKESEYVQSNGEFEEKEETRYELPLIQQGASLGDFVSGECGLDIVLNYGDYKLPLPNDEFVFDLAYARAAEAKIDLSGVLTDYQKKLKREHIFQFLDAAAYFGFHANEGGELKVNSGNATVKKTGAAIYNDVVSRFHTKNILYLYIQSDRTRSYNFYGNYLEAGSVNNLKIGTGLVGLTEEVYGTDEWPLYIDEAPRGHNESQNSLYFQLATDNNVNTMLYGQVAQIVNAQHNNFCGADDLKLPDNLDGTPNIWTKIIQIANPNAGPDGAKVNIAGFNILIYEGKSIKYKVIGGAQTDGVDTISIVKVSDFFDEIFDHISANPIIASESDGYSVLSSQKLKLVNSYKNKKQYGISAVQTITVKDEIDTNVSGGPNLNRVTYLTETIDILNDSTSELGVLTDDTKSSAAVSVSISGSKTFSLPDPFYISTRPFTDGDFVINGIQLITSDSSISNKIVIGVTETENDLLRGIIPPGSVNATLVLISLAETFDGQIISVEGVRFSKYSIVVSAEDAHGNIELSSLPEPVVIYSFDNYYFFSEHYGRYMRQDLTKTKGEINDQDLIVL